MQSSSCTLYLPHDLDRALLVGRVWRHSEFGNGPSVVVVRNGEVFDITRHAPTTADLFDRPDRLDIASQAPGEALGSVESLIAGSLAAARENTMHLLAPCDVQSIKA